MLRNGSSGLEVEKLQESLKRIGFGPGPIDGVFGPKTEAAVRKFQEHAELVVDGIAGPKTMGALEEALREAKKIKKEMKPPPYGGGYPAESLKSPDDKK